MVKDLTLYPLGFHPNPRFEEKLIERGLRVLEYQETLYREYSGSAKAANDDDDDEYDTSGELKSHYVTGRIVIDAFAFRKFEPRPANFFELDEEESAEENTTAGDRDKISMSATLQKVLANSRVGLRPSTETQRSNIENLQKNRECLCLMSPMLPGYSLKLNKWLWFYVDNVKSISWNEEAYDRLVLSGSRKDLVQTFVNNHGQSSASFNNDVIAGKGQVLVILLDGPPGTGKTLTAEAAKFFFLELIRKGAE
ncbi:MAG: hypothetical protein Q9166_006378 [cf. Caloplaca sp. 2 TL-2023]